MSGPSTWARSARCSASPPSPGRWSAASSPTTTRLGWEWAFWINVPVGLAVLAIGWFALTLPRKRSTTPVDYAGILALSATTTSLIFFTDFGGRDGWTLLAGAVAARRLRRLGRRLRRGGAARGRADHPDVAVPQPHLRRRHRAGHGGRPRHVLGDRLHAHVPADELRAVGGELGPADAADDRGIILTIQSSATFIAKTGRYKIFTIAGVAVIMAAMIWMTTLSGATSLWTIGGDVLRASAPGSA